MTTEELRVAIPKGSGLEMAVRRYVITALEQEGVEVEQLKEVELRAKFVRKRVR